MIDNTYFILHEQIRANRHSGELITIKLLHNLKKISIVLRKVGLK